MYFTTIFLLIVSISSISTAPISNQTIKSLFESDNRVEKLKGTPFVNGFCIRNSNLDSFGESLCLALYDIGLSFNKSQILLVGPKEYDAEGFCKNLEQVLPPEPFNKETTAYNGSTWKVEWLKDTLKKSDGEDQCKDKCISEDMNDYVMKPSPICRFLFEQLINLQRLLKSAKAKNPTTNPVVNKPETKVAEIVAAKAFADKKAISDNSQVTLDKESTAPETSPVVAVPATTLNSKNSVSVALPNQTSINSLSSNQTKSNVSAIQTEDKTAKNEKTSDDTNNKDEVKKIDISNGKEDETSKKTQENVDQNVNDDGDNIFDTDASPSEVLQEDKDPDAYNEDEDGMIGDNNRNTGLKQPQTNNEEEVESSNDRNGPKIVDVSFQEDPDSNFFMYLCGVMFLCVFLYVLQQNRNKLLALCLEGRRGNRRNRERSRGGSKAVYSKLDCNLEEAIMSKKSLNGKSMDIIY